MQFENIHKQLILLFYVKLTLSVLISRGDISYSGLENVLNQATHTDDLPGIQDGYSLEFSEFLGTDISGCPSAQGDLNDMPPGMGLHGAEVHLSHCSLLCSR